MYTHYRDKLMTKPVPYARVVKSMLHLLSRTSPKFLAPTPKDSSRAASSPNSKAPASSTRCIGSTASSQHGSPRLVVTRYAHRRFIGRADEVGSVRRQGHDHGFRRLD